MDPPAEGYEPLLGEEVAALEAGQLGARSPSPFATANPDDLLLGHEDEPLDWAAVHNLDQFFEQVYRYWEEKGFTVILVARILNLTALLFTIVASGVLLLGIDYSAIHADCLQTEECTLWDVAFIKHPLRGGPLTLWKALSVIYLAIFAGYWLFSAVHFVHELRGLFEVRHFFAHNIGMSERSLRAATWPEIAARLVAAQRSVRLCISKDLTEHDIVSRIMRKDNYLIGMLNKGVLALHVPIPGFRGHVLLTKTVQWNLRWCVLDAMFNESTFRIQQSFVQDQTALQRRFRIMAVVNAIFSPFLFVFLVIYFFMKNAEALYHHPSSIGARRWSPAARWSLREFNELPHFIEQRLQSGHAAATSYVAQFPNHAVSHIARFIAFITGSFAAVLIALTLADERLLEYDFAAGRQTLWWLGLIGVILAVSRALIIEPSLSAFDPEYSLLEVAAHTHYLPRHWRGRAHTLEVQEEFQSLFRYRAFLLFEELISVLITPILLWYSLPRCAGAILKFVDRNTTCVEGVGDVCTLSTFQHLKTSGSPSLESFEQPLPLEGSLVHPSKKMEQSLVSFSAAYPTWQPPQEAHQFLSKVAAVEEENEMIQENIINNNNNSNLRGNGGVGGGGTSRFSDFRKLRYSDFLNPRYPHSVHRYLHRHYMHHNHNNRVDGTTVEATAAFTRRYPAGIDQGGGNEGGSGSGAGGSATSVFSFGDALNSVMLHSHGTTYPMNASIHTGGGGGGVLSSSAAGGVRQIPPEEERIVVAHALLESYYEQQEEAIEQQQRLEETQHAQQDAAAGNSLVREQDHARGRPSEPQSIPNNDAPSPLPPSLLLPQQINTTRRVSSSVSPYTSPKTGRSLREMSSELSVLSREHSEKDKETGK